MENEIGEKLTAIFRRVLGNETLVVTSELTAGDVAQWDSLSHILLIAEIEKGFLIKFKLRDLSRMRTVGDMMETIQSKLA